MQRNQKKFQRLIDHAQEFVVAALAAAGSKHRLAQTLGLRYQTVLSWYRGTIPSLKNLIRITSFLDRDKKQRRRQERV